VVTVTTILFHHPSLPMSHTTASPSGVRAEPRGWSFFSETSVLAIVDHHGFREEFRVLRLDASDTAFELLASGDQFGESVVVLLGPSGTDADSLCSCPDGESAFPCSHRLAMAALARAWRRSQ
jgi:hypothetical protein